MKHSWEQLPKESAKAFLAFITYRDMGLKRSCQKVAQELKKNLSSVLELSKRHSWQERVKDWDVHLDRESQANQIEQVKAMKERQIDLALNAQKAAAMGLQKLLQHLSLDNTKNSNKDNPISPYAMKPDALSKLLEIGCRLERLNRDEPEQNLEVLSQHNFDKLSLEEAEELRKLLLKAQA